MYLRALILKSSNFLNLKFPKLSILLTNRLLWSCLLISHNQTLCIRLVHFLFLVIHILILIGNKSILNKYGLFHNMKTGLFPFLQQMTEPSANKFNFLVHYSWFYRGIKTCPSSRYLRIYNAISIFCFLINV